MKIEEKELPKGWEVKKLGEVCEILDNLRKPINSTERQQRILGKNQKDLFPYYGATGQVGWIDNFITNGDYILVGEDGAPFLDLFKEKAYKISGKTWVNNHAHILKGKKEKVLDSFVLFYLNSINYREFVNGTTRLKLTKSNLVDIPFVVPPLPEQQKIVAKIEELFSELENGKKELLIAQAKLKTYRQSLLKWAFEGRLTNKNLKEGELPKGWEVIALGKACDKISLNGIKIKQKDYLQKGVFPVVDQGQEIIGGYFNDEKLLVPSEPPYIIFGDHTKVKKFINFKFVAGADGVKVLKPHSIYDPKFFYYLIHTVKIPDKGYARHFQFLEKKEIPLPSLSEQQKIVAILESKLTICDAIEETIKTSIKQGEALRQSILKKAFEGQLITPKIQKSLESNYKNKESKK